jgi:predicted anti-sigma-YlaC factor YlaD
MTCRGVLDALSDYIEGDAGRSVCKKIEEHLEGCVKCRMHVDAMKKMVILYKRWRDDPIPEDVQMRLQDVFARECLSEGPGSAVPARHRPAGRKPTKPSTKPPRKR